MSMTDKIAEVRAMIESAISDIESAIGDIESIVSQLKGGT